MGKVFLVFALSLFFTISTIWAEEKKEQEKKDTKLEEIVVSATKTEKDIVSAPASVSVVTKEDISKKYTLTVDQTMDALPGVIYRQHRNIMTTWPTVTLRGISGQRRTLVLLDGVPLNEPLNGGVRFAGYAPEDLERVEVVRGSFSSLYGGYAMGGVINMLTKTPEKREITLRAGYGTGFKDGGAPDVSRVYLSYGDKFFDKLSLFLSYSRNTAKDFATDFNVQATKPPAGITGWSQTTNEFGAVRYLIGDRGNNDWWDDNITIKAGYDFSKNSKINLLVALSIGDLTKALHFIVFMHQNRCSNMPAALSVH